MCKYLSAFNNIQVRAKSPESGKTNKTQQKQSQQNQQEILRKLIKHKNIIGKH